MTATTVYHCNTCDKEVHGRVVLQVTVACENPGVFQSDDLHFCSFECLQSFIGGIILAEAMTV